MSTKPHKYIVSFELAVWGPPGEMRMLTMGKIIDELALHIEGVELADNVYIDCTPISISKEKHQAHFLKE